MRPLALDKVTREEALGFGRLCGRALAGSFVAGGRTFAFKVAETVPEFTPALCVRLELDGRACLLELGASFFSVLPEPFSTIDPATLADDVRAMVVECLLADAFAELEPRLGATLRVAGVDIGAVAAEAPLRLPLLVGDQATRQTAPARLRFDAPVLDPLWRLSAGKPSKANPAIDAVPVGGVIEAGRTRLCLGELRALSPMDLVLVSNPAGHPGHDVVLTFPGGPAFAAALANDTLTLQRTLRMANDAPQDNPQATADQPDNTPEGASDAVETVEVECVFAAGIKTLTVAELRALAPGSVVSLDKPLEGPVTLLANGKPVARCELLDMEGTLAARVLTLGDA